MQNNLSEQIRNCFRHSEDCARKAAEQTDRNLKHDFLELEVSWLFLARSFEFNERLSRLAVRSQFRIQRTAKRLFRRTRRLRARPRLSIGFQI